MTVWLRALVALSALVATTNACSGSPTAPTPPPPTQAGPPPVAGPESATTVSWDDLPTLTQEGARQFIIDNNLNTVFVGAEVGAVKRWLEFPIALYATEDFAPAEVSAAVAFWEDISEGKITFRLVSSATEARLVLDTIWPPPEPMDNPERACAGANAKKLERNIILSGFGHFAFKAKPDCARAARREIIAHELGHALGIFGGPKGPGHTTTRDVMNASPVWSSSEFLREVISLIYSVRPGTRPV